MIALLLIINCWWGLYLGEVAAMAPSNAEIFLLGLAGPILLYLICDAAHAGTFRWNEHMWFRLVIIGLCAPLIWTRKRLFHWLAAIVVLAIMLYVLFETVLH